MSQKKKIIVSHQPQPFQEINTS